MMSEIRERYCEVKKRVDEAAERSGRKPGDVTLLVVTKRHGVDEINEVIDAGATDIGENKVQELLEKYDSVKPVRWHLIGHLQRNKVKSVVDKVVMIHSVDSFRLAEEIDKRCAAAGITMDVLIEINLVMEESKTGLPKEDLRELLTLISENCSNVRVKGLMCIPPYGLPADETRRYFRELKKLQCGIAEWGFPKDIIDPEILSMGMSGDYEAAIEEGSDIVRVGTAIMGERRY